jgi:hypothetical protein
VVAVSRDERDDTIAGKVAHFDEAQGKISTQAVLVFDRNHEMLSKRNVVTSNLLVVGD